MTAENWSPISRTDVDVWGVDNNDPSRLRVGVTLSARPPRAWEEHFNRRTEAGELIKIRRPYLSGNLIQLTPKDDELQRDVEFVDRLIAASNEYYERDVLPKLRQEEQRRVREQAENERRIADAKRRAGEL